jgi:hypothetical protein
MVDVTPTNLQKMEFDVTAGGVPTRVTVVTGTIPGNASVFSPGNNPVNQSVSLRALVDPTLPPGQFRKATATAALAATSATQNPPSATAQFGFGFSIDNVEASLDDETGRIELRVDATANIVNGVAGIGTIAFQVTTLSVLPP